MIWRAHFAPTELGVFLSAVAINILLLTELKAFACGPRPRCYKFELCQLHNACPESS